jgi:hypothetical protein
MPTQLKDGIKILFDTISNNLRHQDYQRVLDVAKDYTTYGTGHGIGEKLRQFNRRETLEEFNQRCALTQVNTPDIFASCTKPMYKMGRTPATITATWDGKDSSKNEEMRKKLFDAGKNFWGKKSVQKYIAQRQADLDSMDPNSFVVVEFKENVDPTKPDTKANPYPFEVNSAEAINFLYQNQDLQWIVVLNWCLMKDKKDKEIRAEKYYMYIDNESITATQIHKDKVEEYMNLKGIQFLLPDQIPAPLTEYIYITGEKTESKRRYYIVKVYEHKIGFVPAKRFGTVLDPLTRNRTCIPLIHAAKSYFEKSIKTMSEFDLTNCLHVFPQKIQYADPCPGEPMEKGDQFFGCQNGYRPDGKTLCGACKGSGFKFHTSSQDLIQIRMPKDLEKMVPLDNMIAYKSPPMDLIKFQKDFGFFELRRLAQGAVYNSDVFSREEIAQTATGKQIDLDAVYDTLSTFADSWSEMFVHIYKCIASLRDISQGLELIHQFPSDFKMESFGTLLDYLQKATTNDAPPHIKKAITRKITNKTYADEPREILKIDIKDKFNPFPGKKESEVNFILANDLTTTFNKIFYSHFDFVFSELEYETGLKKLDFYALEQSEQKKLITDKVNQIILEIDNEDAASAATGFNASTQNTENANDGSAAGGGDESQTGNTDSNQGNGASAQNNNPAT